MKIACLVSLAIACANATPVREAATNLEKRDTEIIYLANCANFANSHLPIQHWSEIIYYANSADSDNKESFRGPTTVWEENQKRCTFPSGVTFDEAIDADAQSRPDFSFAGWGWNGKTWNCFKDNNRLLFAPPPADPIDGCRSSLIPVDNGWIRLDINRWDASCTSMCVQTFVELGSEVRGFRLEMYSSQWARPRSVHHLDGYKDACER
ncbi:hypothetical protein C8J57DRAFT_1238182 [Mycena rebaudengoi]|nr:hypothetical protein C8J57DRAFT_1238182 [Mycena rebaudengoi]